MHDSDVSGERLSVYPLSAEDERGVYRERSRLVFVDAHNHMRRHRRQRQPYLRVSCNICNTCSTCSDNQIG